MRKFPRAKLGPAFRLGWLLILLLPTAAQAHPGGSDTDLLNGLMHPVFGLDHLLAMISVGVVSAQLGRNNIWRVPLAFVGGMTVGGTLGILQFTLVHAELGIAASVLVLGIGIVLAHRQMSPWSITALVLFFGVLHGYAHGLEIPQFRQPIALHAGLPDQYRGAAHLWCAHRRGGHHANMALEWIAFLRGCSGSRGRGVLAANTGAGRLRGLPDRHIAM